MAHPPIKKQEFLGAVTLVSFSSDGSLLYVGVGPTVFLYATATGEILGEHDVLTRGILHGCDIVAHPGSDVATESFVGAFFGQKRASCFQNLPQTPGDARGLEALAVLGKPKVFCDWVFDVQLLTGDFASGENKNLLAAVGLAHNFVQIWDPVCNEILRSVQSAERCILYALAFHGRSMDDLVAASGTVFQQILLWNPMENGGEETNTAIEPAQRLHAHDGVLFKLTWSSDARSLASVSDDRTVQLWSNNGTTTVEQLHLPRRSTRAELLTAEYTPVFRAWGHSARIWDVSFWARGVVTASEDGLCKLWDLEGNCAATLQGHMGRHVWRAAVHPSLNMIASGGGDGAVKLWDITRQLMSSSGAPGASDLCKTVRVLITTTPAAVKRKKGAPSSHSVRNIVLSAVDNGKTAFVASEHGDVFRLDLSSLTTELFFAIPPTDDALVQTRTGGLSTFAMDFSGRFLLLGEVTGRVCIVDASTGILLLSWSTQTNVRVMKLWWDQEDALFSSGANGILSEWKPTIAETSETLASPSITMDLVATFKIPAKSSTSSILVVDRLATTRNIVAGDGHGSVYMFHRSLNSRESDEQSKAVQPPALVLKGSHGRELVASLLLSEENEGVHTVMLSGGQDGYICSYVLEEDARGVLTAVHVGRESIRGISTIKQLWWGEALTFDAKTKRDLMVFGFHAAQAVLHNFSAHYRVFNVECGGWRRPHALFTRAGELDSALPSHTFAFTPPATQKQQVDIKVHSTLLNEPNAADTSTRFSKCSLHDHHHGRMTTCVAFLGKMRLVTAAEDNSLILHRRHAYGDQDKRTSFRWGSVASGIAHTTTVRALTTFQRKNPDGVDDHIILSGGGKQRLNVWLVRGESDLLRHVCGQEPAETAQDHRILGLATFAIPSASDAYRLVAACNSEGSTQLLLLDVNHGKLFELGNCRSSSRKPILSCVGFQEGDDDAVVAGLAVGSTDGLVTLWDLSALLKKIPLLLRSEEGAGLFKEKLQGLIGEMQPSGNYLAHDMGVNCINLVFCKKSKEEGSLDVALISGGDDQNLNLRELRFPACQMISEARAVNASGSAIKTVACVDAEVIYTAGYDQRVSKWNIRCDESGTGLEWQGAVFSECADIADLAIRQTPAGATDEVVVVGQGLQMMQFQRRRQLEQGCRSNNTEGPRATE
ncbi:WD repeat-containing protein 6 [Phytophthora pseudosyringae]|uniref:WD repeat-containing protein 6 n=1 Tax=Phytophthora pseudosyringae TaxID=221518 RepID=A0A8T1WJ29_9STRA|nr:WD repeat-containing protein 6 [Phytophthora pseudosyringae]